MSLATTTVFYCVIGIGVSIAVFLAEGARRPADLVFRTATAVLFWPLYVPVLLTRPSRPSAALEMHGLQGGGMPGGERAPEPDDEMNAALGRVEAELDAALQSLDGWAEDVLAGEEDRFQELRSAWRMQAQRIRDLDRLLQQVGEDQPGISIPAAGGGNTDRPSEGRHPLPPPGHQPPIQVRIRQSEQVRRENIERMKHLRGRMYDDLMATLAWVRELVTMIHLAKFTGAPASRAEELVGQIAAAVEGLSEVSTWQEPALAAAE